MKFMITNKSSSPAISKTFKNQEGMKNWPTNIHLPDSHHDSQEPGRRYRDLYRWPAAPRSTQQQQKSSKQSSYNVRTSKPPLPDGSSRAESTRPPGNWGNFEQRISCNNDFWFTIEKEARSRHERWFAERQSIASTSMHWLSKLLNWQWWRLWEELTMLLFSSKNSTVLDTEEQLFPIRRLCVSYTFFREFGSSMRFLDSWSFFFFCQAELVTSQSEELYGTRVLYLKNLNGSEWYICLSFASWFHDSKHWHSWRQDDQFLWIAVPSCWRCNSTVLLDRGNRHTTSLSMLDPETSNVLVRTSWRNSWLLRHSKHISHHSSSMQC